MKEIERKDMPEISGGRSGIEDGPCFPSGPTPPEWDYPREPIGPLINNPPFPDPTQSST